MIDKEQVKEKIKRLVEKYLSLKEQCKIRTNDEEQIKQHFIEPLFEILGWNMREPEEVVKEEKVGRKKVDFAFKINDQTKFFIEAKAHNIDLLDKIVVEQALGYGWNGGITWTVLTNFEKIFLLNCEWKVGNLLLSVYKTLSLDQFATDKFEDLWLLSKESFLTNRLDALAEKEGRKAKKAPVTAELFNDLTKIRNYLRGDILKNSPKLRDDPAVLEEIIQRIIDKLIFIRKTEDLGIEDFPLKKNLRLYQSGQLKELCKKIQKTFVEFDDKYNSEMFKPSHISNTVDISDEAFSKVIALLYSTDERFAYDFASIPADVLGNIYEQYLGLLLKGGEIRGKYENSSAKRKEQGIYYTPTYIVDYIVKSTIGEWIKERNNDITQIKVLDPACGSGSFLIKALDYLAKERKKRDGKEHQNTITNFYEAQKATSLKSEIAVNNIYGVDLDEKAVDVTQLNLLLKIAENRQKLPKLRENIKVGNSLIDDSTVSPRAFKWKEQFKEIISSGGFDVVVGNPPYVDIKQLDPVVVKYLFNKYITTENRMNLYSTFVEKSFSLLKEGGYFGFIIPNSILYNESYQKTRGLLLSNATLKQIVRLPDNVFENVKVETIILIYQKKKETTKKENCNVLIYSREAVITTISDKNCNQIINFNQNVWAEGNKIINISTNSKSNVLLKKIEKSGIPMVEICDFCLGLTPYDKYKGHTKEQIEKRAFHSTTKKNDTFKPLLSGENIIRYGVFWDKKEYISYGNWLGAPREKKFFTEPRIIVRQIISGKPARIYAGYTEAEFYNAQIGFNILLKDSTEINIKYILALFNSRLINYFHKEKYLDQSKNLFQKILIANAKQFPIKLIPLSQQQPLIKLADRMLSLNKRLNELKDKSTDEKAKLEEEIKETDQEIDELVYLLYGITEEEKKIIEESLK